MFPKRKKSKILYYLLCHISSQKVIYGLIAISILLLDLVNLFNIIMLNIKVVFVSLFT